ncbi:MAG TPA: alpha/beta fold hydrolase [Methylomirabilota bacterium]|jgi:pimeloyl-ACP methyl ester carboxylesterase|nr:alpha/beta fold hydrolase [Methylomirabilota bacterium]
MQRTRINGVELAYELQGAGEPLVMIHGAQGDQSMFAAITPTFIKHFQVLTFDQRGSGLSEKPDMEYSMAMFADDTAALMDHVGFASAHILGVSMGGMIAQEFALRHPQKTRSLVLGCTTPGGPKAVSLGSGALAKAYSTQPMTAEERGRLLAEACFTKGYLEKHPEVIPAMIEARRRRPIDPVALGHRMKAVYAHDTYDRLPQIACPTLVITGKDDVLVPWENSRILAERIPGAQFVLLEPAGHLFWGEQPEQAREALLSFLLEQNKKTSS